MDLVSLIVKLLTPNMTERIANALLPDRTAKRSMLIVCSAICVGLAFPTPSFAQKKRLYQPAFVLAPQLFQPRGSKMC